MLSTSSVYVSASEVHNTVSHDQNMLVPCGLK